MGKANEGTSHKTPSKLTITAEKIPQNKFLHQTKSPTPKHLKGLDKRSVKKSMYNDTLHYSPSKFESTHNKNVNIFLLQDDDFLDHYFGETDPKSIRSKRDKQKPSMTERKREVNRNEATEIISSEQKPSSYPQVLINKVESDTTQKKNENERRKSSVSNSVKAVSTPPKQNETSDKGSNKMLGEKKNNNILIEDNSIKLSIREEDGNDKHDQEKNEEGSESPNFLSNNNILDGLK